MFSDRYCYVPRELSPISGKRENLFWPVYAWRVLYPDDRQQPGCNLFQETLLGLMRAGVTDAAKLAELMAIDLELVRFIIASQLQPNGWLDHRNKVMPDGERLLDQAEDRRLNLRVGYAFQDAIGGKLLPRFSTELHEIQPGGTDQNNRPVFVLDRNTGRSEKPFLLQAKAPAKADVQGLMAAYRQYRHELAHARRGSETVGFDVTIRTLDYVDDQPLKLYFWCELYRDENGPQRWLISDPFRLRPAVSWLREPFLDLAKGSAELTRRMQRLLPDMSADGLSVDEWFERLAEHADFEVESKYPFLKSRAPLVREHLLRVLRQRAKIEEAQGRIHPEDLGALMTESASLIEAVLKWLLEEWPVEPCWPKKGNWTPAEALNELRALSIQAIDDELAQALAGQPRGFVAKAMTHRDRPMKALLAGVLFAANARDDHPVHRLSTDQLQLPQLPRLADYRNKVGGHASGERPDKGTTLEYSEFAIEWMRLFESWY
ncbi:hypothetical protein [Cognatazoarcus halotolerans]|uniref:hypothetical protein n=1 Tax=Cognatazoarcus halotolerans TaxID=2686016 RepID=UPI00135891D5|nr:hypothetical protein [Cognatazoarcus halotolerans]